jgi:hypothetical protein
MSVMTKKLFLSLALCLALFGVVSPALAQTDQKSGEDTLAQLQREGWKIVSDGLLQRELVPGEVESFAFGVSGFIWKVKDLQKQLQKLQAEFRANPTPELRKAIANHRKAIASAKRALANARAAEARGQEIDLSKVSCALNFSYDAAGGPKTDVQGIWANASATFGSSGTCGFTGQVYAYAFAKTWVNGAESTETVTDGPRSGANVSATAYASRNGGGPCETQSYGEMLSDSLSAPPYTWTKRVITSSCPPVVTPLNVTAASNAPSTTIDLYNSDCITITWAVNYSGGTPPHVSMMYLNGASVGAGTAYSKTYCNAGTNTSLTATFSVTVADSSNPTQSKSASAPTITIQSHAVVSSPNVTINGPTYLGVTACTTYTWTASVSGGTSPYAYQWTWAGTVVGTGSSYSRSYCPGKYYSVNTYTLGLTVTDSANRTGSDSESVTVERFGQSIDPGCGGSPCP